MTYKTYTEHFYTDKEISGLIGGHSGLLFLAPKINQKLFRHNC